IPGLKAIGMTCRPPSSTRSAFPPTPPGRAGWSSWTHPRCSYHLVCLYPTVFQNQAAVVGTQTVGPKPRKNVNTTSAVMGLSLSARPKKWRVLFGADLHLSGWRSLVAEKKLLSSDVFIAPHHGGPQEATKGFGYAELARVVSPTDTIVSVGTEQK